MIFPLLQEHTLIKFSRDYREGTEETDFPKFLTETKIQQDKYKWEGPKQLESNPDK